MTHYSVALKHIMQFGYIRKAAVRGGGGIISDAEVESGPDFVL